MTKHKILKPNVIRGGVAVPLGSNYYYMQGRKHKDGGIDVGNNPRTGLEVEDGEVMHVAKDEVKVFSSVPFLNGESPAQKVLGGENPTTVFRQQEQYKDRNGINDDGTKKKTMGGYESVNEDKDEVPKLGYPHLNGFLKYTPFAQSFINRRIDKLNEHIKNKSLEEVRQKLYDYVYPVGYNNMEDRFLNAVDSNNNRKRIKGSSVRDDIWATYLNIPKNKRRKNVLKLIESKYRPTKGEENDIYYALPLNDVEKRQIISDAKYPERKLFTNNGLDFGGNKLSTGLKHMLGTHTIGRGVDKNKGEYISYYDKWDLSGSHLMEGDTSGNIGTPVNIYDRIYLDDYYGVNSAANKGDYYGGYTPEISIYNKKESKSMGGLSNPKHYKHHQRVSKETQEDISEELGIPRRRYKAGGLYSITVDGKTVLRRFPSTGEDTKMRCGGRKKAETGTRSYYEDLILSTPHIGGDASYLYDLPHSTKNSNGQSYTPIEQTFETDGLSYVYTKPTQTKTTTTVTSDKPRININNIEDYIGLASNTIGGLVSHAMNRSTLNKLKYNSQPVARPAAKLKTRININPQLDKMRESLATYERNIDNNTASSNVALARKQHARLANVLQTNELFGSKENMETELINKDKLNRQAVAAENIKDYNDWSEKKAAFENAVIDKKGENNVALIETLNQGVQDIIGRREKRNSERQTRLAMAAANPNVNPRILRDLGIKGITDEDIERWERAFGKKNNKN